MNKKFILISLLVISILQLIALWPSFRLSLYGDDWLTFWHLWSNSDPVIGLHYSPIRFFLTPYGPLDMNMGFLRMFFGYNSLPYYVASFLWRLSASFALFFLSLKLLNNKLGALFAGVFFAVSMIGLQTTDWVFDMISYMGLFLYIICNYFFFLSRQNRNYKLLIIYSIFLFLAMITVPIRMHGAFFLIIFAEFLWLITNLSIEQVKYTLFRIATFISTIIVIQNIGSSFGNTGESITRMITGLTFIINSLKQGQPDILLHPIMSFGNMIIPELIWPQLNTGVDLFVIFSVIIFAIFVLLLLLLTPKENKTKGKLFKIIIVGLVYNFTVWLMFKYHTQGFSPPYLLGSALVGGYTTILLLNLVFNKTFGRKYIVYSSMIIFWPYAFILFPWIAQDTNSVYPTDHRYMIMSSAGIALIWALLTLLKINKKILVVLFILYTFFHLSTTYSYFDRIAHKRNREISTKIWTAIEKDLPHFDEKKTYVVLFLTGDPMMNYYHGYFGFNPRIAVRDKIRGFRAPVPVADMQSLVSAVTDGKIFTYNLRDEKPIPPDQIIAFLIAGDSLENVRVQNITGQLRENLRTISENYLKSHPGVNYQN